MPLQHLNPICGYVQPEHGLPGSFSGDDGSGGLTSPGVGRGQLDWSLRRDGLEGLGVFNGFHMAGYPKMDGLKWNIDGDPSKIYLKG